MIHSAQPNPRERRGGTVFFLLWLFVLPGACTAVNSLLPRPLNSGALNFAFYGISFLICIAVFRRYLLSSLKENGRRLPAALLWACIGFLGNFAAGQLLQQLFAAVIPGFSNANDDSVLRALEEAPVLMTVGVVLLVPVTEETLFRGLLFRGLYDRSPVGAYLLSTLAFALLHVMGYIGTAAPAVLVLNFLQYLPAGLLLCLACRYGGGVLSPMLMHALINGASILLMR